MTTKSSARSIVAVASGALMTTVLGSIHAFSVFVPEWETLQGADRSAVSLVYSVALVSLTVAVLFGHLVFQRLAAFGVYLLAGIGAAAGLLLSANSDSLLSLYLFYGVIFGAANGLGYGYALQLAGQAMPSRRGLAMGIVTAFYALGATAFPLLFSYLIDHGGNARALMIMALIVLVTSSVAALMVFITKIQFSIESAETRSSLTRSQRSTRILFWIGYGSGATAGLMVIGHAYGIAVWSGLDRNLATSAVILVAFGNMLGGFMAGYWADRLSARSILFYLPSISAAALIAVYAFGTHVMPVIWVGVAVVGFSYGALIAVYPVAVTDVFGERAAPRVYGQVFTAWGLAGLIGPWSSGWLFDRSGSYSSALLLAVLFCIASAITTRFFPIADFVRDN